MTPIPTELRELLERIAHDDEGMASLADFEELKRLLATPPADAADMGGQAGEEVEVVAWLSEVRSGNKTVIRASMSETSLEGMRRGYQDENAIIVRDEPCMTVAQHERIVAAISAQQSEPERVSVPVELLERTIDRLEHGHEHDKAVRELRALLASTGQEVKP